MGGKQNLFRSIVHNRVTDFANIFVNTMKSSLEHAKHTLDGCFAIHKPSGITSAQVIRNVQKQFDPSKLFKPLLDAELASRAAHRERDPRQKKSRRERRPLAVKMGHGGTLDPGATGVLVLGVGSATKALPRFLECTKSYETVLLLGAATDTYDVWGKVVARKSFQHVTRAAVEKALNQFRGNIMQKPPIFSALRVQGKRLYEYAREGKEVPVEIKERPVQVVELELMEWMEGGSHEWHWPTEEAPQAEKDVAQTVLGLNGEEEQKKSHKTTAKDERQLAQLSDTSMFGGLLDDTSRELESEQVKGTNPKRKLEDTDGFNSSTIEANSPASKRIRSTADSAGGTSLTPIVSIASSTTLPVSTSEEAAHANTSSLSSQTTCARCPAPAMRIRMTVTSGFYVRSLCQDLGVAVGSLGTMASLVRTRQADFTVGMNVLAYEDLAEGEDVWGPKVQQMLLEWQGKERETKQDSGKSESDKDMMKQSIEKDATRKGEKLNQQERVSIRMNTSSAEAEN